MLIFTIGLIAGIVVGSIATNLIFQRSKVGTLRVDRSDPEDDPYLFLELDKGVGDITAKHQVLLKVNTDSYLPHK